LYLKDFFELIPDAGAHFSGLIWVLLLVSAAIVITIPTSMAIKSLVISVIFRLIFSLGPEFTLTLLGFAIVSIALFQKH
jgi:hypothetical protein